MEETVGGEALAHGVGEIEKFDPVHMHDAYAPQVQPFGEVENGAAVSQQSVRVGGGQGGAWRASGRRPRG